MIEYISNVNTQYTQVLMELNENGVMDVAYTYGVSHLTEDRFTGESNFYLYAPAGNVAGITDQDGYLWQSYRYDAFGNAIFGAHSMTRSMRLMRRAVTQTYRART